MEPNLVSGTSSADSMALLRSRGVVVRGEISGRFSSILTVEALQFVAALHRSFEGTRQKLLSARAERQKRLDSGENPTFLKKTKKIRQSDWTCASIPGDLQDRRVEITGPVSAKMIINALNSGAKVFMADFEDSNAPTWANNIDGQVNLNDAVNGTLEWRSPDGKSYKLNPSVATLMVRPRGWHLVEAHMLVDGSPVSASLFDFGLYFFHNAHMLLKKGSGPYFYLPKMESHLEARLWNDVFSFSEAKLGLAKVTRATVLIETILAAFEMDEILYELREHSAGLNCGRWDYLFSAIKKFITRKDYVMGDRGQLTMVLPFMQAYVQLLIQTCHRRGVHAMGGMAAQIPIRDNKAANDAAIEKVRQDKLREVKAGHDGTWVAHPGLIPLAMEVFNTHMSTPNQIAVKRETRKFKAEDLIAFPRDVPVTEAGLRGNIYVSLLYLEAWLKGNGCVPINNLMEDLATAEIARSQLYQWIKHKSRTVEGKEVTLDYVMQLLTEEVTKLKSPQLSALEGAAQLLKKMITADTFPEFMSLEAYPAICKFIAPASPTVAKL